MAQYSNGSTFDSTVSDPFMEVVPALEQGYTSSAFSTPTSGFRAHHVNLTAPTTRVGDDASTALRSPRLRGYRSRVRRTRARSSTSRPASTGSPRPCPSATVVYGFDQDDSYGFPGGFRLARVAEANRLSLSPAAPSGVVGRELCTTARLSDQDDAGIAGARVDVTTTGVVTDERSLVTGGDGSATYCLTSATAGAAAVRATSSGLTADATLTWTAPPVNQPPVATPATLTTPQDTALPVTLKGTDPEGDPLTYADRHAARATAPSPAPAPTAPTPPPPATTDPTPSPSPSPTPPTPPHPPPSPSRSNASPRRRSTSRPPPPRRP